MHRAETVILKIAAPTTRKRDWLTSTAQAFRDGVGMVLRVAESEKTSSRARLHNACYAAIREKAGLPSDYARMVVNAGVALARSYWGLRKGKRKAGFPKVGKSQGIGLGVNAYAVLKRGERFFLRASTGKRGESMWLPLAVPVHLASKLQFVHGDAKLFQRGQDWFVMLPLRLPHTPAVRDGEPTVLGVDLGIVRLATVVTPDGCKIWNGLPVRHRREHFASLRRRYQRHRRTDRIKAQGGKERRWMHDLNHKLSRELVDLARFYPNAVIALEQLDGIRDRVRGSKRFNRMMSSWTFRDLVDKVRYKAEAAGVGVVFVDPRQTSQTCHRCGHATRSNRTSQAEFRCVSCGFRGNADINAATNIAAAGLRAVQQGPLDTARPAEGQELPQSEALDGVKECGLLHSDPNLASP
ncbi:RNA-guided endonuclease TnpB family protein [Deinococcus sp. YIM 77859]|uniref:RNA-guided endonuclease InsQ/TnpB family protein n=1 Tax=Deinococcus sp. YIM 77859 TaxID=1540221 RepID=UPI0009DCFC70|nr:RNA-guided endonuclease TnpB family protein [Deinococcus sp. YIM 77859]